MASAVKSKQGNRITTETEIIPTGWLKKQFAVPSPGYAVNRADLPGPDGTMSATTKYGPGAIGSLVRFGLLALLPVVALGAVLAHVLNADVQQRYLDTSRTSATLITQVGIQPLLNSQQLTSGLSPAEVAQIDDKLQGAAVSDEVRRIKVWNRSGTIVYSDNHVLIGK